MSSRRAVSAGREAFRANAKLTGARLFARPVERQVGRLQHRILMIVSAETGQTLAFP